MSTGAVDGDPTHTSTKVRLAAMKALNDVGRPLTAHELEEWLMHNDKELWTEVSGKCYDYIRMILSLTRNNGIVKYRPNVTVRGVDKRVAFYGIPGESYGGEWGQISGLKKRGRTRKKPKGSSWSVTHPSDDEEIDDSAKSSEGAPKSPSDSKTDTPKIPEVIEEVIDYQALNSWKALSDRCDLQNPLWSQLLCALTDAKDYIEDERTAEDVLRHVFKNYPLLLGTDVIQDVTTIICREIIIIKEMKSCEAVL
jgi:hypothetical protein